MTKKQIDMCRHAWGADSKEPGYRNRYCTHTSEDIDMNWLVGNGYFVGPKYVGNFGEDHGMYYLSDKGIQFVKNVGKSLDRRG